jgi:hypothetical protein
VKSSALIGLGCQGSRVESEATSLPSRDFAQRELNPAVARFEAGLLSVWDLHLNAHYRRFPAKPFHDFPPGFTSRTLLNDVSNLLKSFLDSYRGVAHRDVGNIMR